MDGLPSTPPADVAVPIGIHSLGSLIDDTYAAYSASEIFGTLFFLFFAALLIQDLQREVCKKYYPFLLFLFGKNTLKEQANKIAFSVVDNLCHYPPNLFAKLYGHGVGFHAQFVADQIL